MERPPSRSKPIGRALVHAVGISRRAVAAWGSRTTALHTASGPCTLDHSDTAWDGRRDVPRLRHQLSLYVPPPWRDLVDAVRAVVDPEQHRLIPAHVTLCREQDFWSRAHEATALGSLRQLGGFSVTLTFGEPERFHEHGIFMPAVGGVEEFDALRQQVIGVERARARRQVPHLTLAHPRNRRAPGNSLRVAEALAGGIMIPFTRASWIEQVDDEPWRVCEEF